MIATALVDTHTRPDWKEAVIAFVGRLLIDLSYDPEEQSEFLYTSGKLDLWGVSVSTSVSGTLYFRMTAPGPCEACILKLYRWVGGHVWHPVVSARLTPGGCVFAQSFAHLSAGRHKLIVEFKD